MTIKSYTPTPGCGLIWEYAVRQEDGSPKIYEMDVIGVAIVNNDEPGQKVCDELEFVLLYEQEPVNLSVVEADMESMRQVYILGINYTEDRTTVETLSEHDRKAMETTFLRCGSLEERKQEMLSTASYWLEKMPRLTEDRLFEEFLKNINECFLPEFSDAALRAIAKTAFEFKELNTADRTAA